MKAYKPMAFLFLILISLSIPIVYAEESEDLDIIIKDNEEDIHKINPLLIISLLEEIIWPYEWDIDNFDDLLEIIHYKIDNPEEKQIKSKPKDVDISELKFKEDKDEIEIDMKLRDDLVLNQTTTDFILLLRNQIDKKFYIALDFHDNLIDELVFYNSSIEDQDSKDDIAENSLWSSRNDEITFNFEKKEIIHKDFTERDESNCLNIELVWIKLNYGADFELYFDHVLIQVKQDYTYIITMGIITFGGVVLIGLITGLAFIRYNRRAKKGAKPKKKSRQRGSKP